MGTGGRNMSYARDALAEFHAALPELSAKAQTPSLRRTLHGEEGKELRKALGDIRLCEAVAKSVPPEAYEHLAKELADVVIVSFGTARVAGINLDRAVEIVHEDNMAKLAAGTVRADGKLVKPEGWPQPDMSEAVL